MIAVIAQEGEQHAAFFRLGQHHCAGTIVAHSVLPARDSRLSPRFTPSTYIRLTMHEPPSSEENNTNSPAVEATLHMSRVDLQQFIAGLSALERQLRGVA